MANFLIGTAVEDGIPHHPEKGQKIIKDEHALKNALDENKFGPMDIVFLGEHIRRSDSQSGSETVPLPQGLKQRLEQTGALIERLR